MRVNPLLHSSSQINTAATRRCEILHDINQKVEHCKMFIENVVQHGRSPVKELRLSNQKYRKATSVYYVIHTGQR